MPPRLQKRFFAKFIELTLLVVMLCPAPVPVGHCHGEGGFDGSEQQMLLHFQTCHGGLANVDHWPSGWHWHWVLQMDTFIGGHDVGSKTQCDLVVDNTNFVACVLPCESKLDAWVWESTTISPSVPPSHRHSFTTIGLLASCHSLPELLGVIRC